MDKNYITKEMQFITNSRNKGFIGRHYHLYKPQEDVELDFDFGNYIISNGIINSYRKRKNIEQF